MDLRADIAHIITLDPGQRVLIPTNIKIALPTGYEAQVRPRSGLALKQGVGAILGTIDSDYRGYIGVIMHNFSNKPFEVNDGDRVAQLVISRYETVEWNPVLFLDETERAEGGFGHSGVE